MFDLPDDLTTEQYIQLIAQQMADNKQLMIDAANYLTWALPFCIGCLLGSISIYSLWREVLKW